MFLLLGKTFCDKGPITEMTTPQHSEQSLLLCESRMNNKRNDSVMVAQALRSFRYLVAVFRTATRKMMVRESNEGSV